jgi:hypothetical protein
MRKQTAVQFWANKFNYLSIPIELREEIKVILQKAYEMEAEQILDAYRNGRTDERSEIITWSKRTAREFYNQTYGGKDA